MPSESAESFMDPARLQKPKTPAYENLHSSSDMIMALWYNDNNEGQFRLIEVTMTAHEWR
jgi:hypothetical protein